MSSCRTALCANRDLGAYRIGLSTRVHIYCAQCAATVARYGAYIQPVERRVDDVPVETERRAWRPAWLRNLTAKDMTGRVLG